MKEIILQPISIDSLEKRVSINRDLISKTIDLMNEGGMSISEAKHTIANLSNINKELVNTISTFYQSTNTHEVGSYSID